MKRLIGLQTNTRKQALVLATLLIYSFVHAQEVKSIRIAVNANNKQQVIENIGESGCWFAEGIGKYWPAEKKNKIAELLFSKALDKQGNPKGIGLSAWRFNVGAGTTEQLNFPTGRHVCYLSPF